MKHFLVACMFILLFSGCEKKNKLSLFGTKFSSTATPKTYIHDATFLNICKLKQIYNTVIPVTGSPDEIRKILTPVLPANYPINQVITLFVYTTQTDTSKIEVALNETHAMSIVRQQGRNLYHDYLENQNGKFSLLPEFTAQVNGGFDMDDIRLFHFASSPGQTLPETSMYFEIRMEPLGDISNTGSEPNKAIGDAMLMNLRLNKGMNTLDLYGEDFIKVLARDNPPGTGDTYCGNNSACGLGSENDVCLLPAGGHIPPPKCEHPRSGCCNNVMLEAAKMSTDGKLPFDFHDLFQFKDGFLMKYKKSREYIGYIYLVGRRMRMDIPSMLNYIEVTKTVQSVMEKMNGKDDNAVIFDDNFIKVFSTFISNHKGLKSKELDQAMDNMQKDMTSLKGYTRSQVMNYLEETNR